MLRRHDGQNDIDIYQKDINVSYNASNGKEAFHLFANFDRGCV
jgi:hypothetical protein